MADVLGNEPRSTPRWLIPAALLGLVAAAIVLPGRNTAPPPVVTPTATPTPAALPDPGTAPNGCGGVIPLPLTHLAPGLKGTGLRLLVGDRDLRVVDVDAGTSRLLRASAGGRSITQLRPSPRGVLAVVGRPCGALGFGTGEVALVDPRTGGLTTDGPGDELLPGTPVTALDYDPNGDAALRTVGSHASTPVPVAWRIVGRRGASFYAVVQKKAEIGTIALADPATRRLSRELGVGTDVAANETGIVWLTSGCRPGACLLAWTRADGVATALPLHNRYAWGGALSPDGRRVAFRLARNDGQLGDHPGPPYDVAVADLPTGTLTVLPGLVLPTKAGLTLAWSSGGWLAIGADAGRGDLLLLWREGMERPAQVPLPPSRGGTTGPPALAFLPQSR